MNSTHRDESETPIQHLSVGSTLVMLEMSELQLLRHLVTGMNELRGRLDRILRSIGPTLEGMPMSQSLDLIKAAVARVEDEADKEIAFMQALAQQLADAANDPPAITALAASLNAEADKLAASRAPATPPVVTPPTDSAPPVDTQAPAVTTTPDSTPAAA